MVNDGKWRKMADELLAAPVRKKRNLKSVAGKVDDRLESVYAARQRGMAWKDIAAALEDGAQIKVDAVESAFKRICKERAIAPPKGAARGHDYEPRIATVKTIDLTVPISVTETPSDALSEKERPQSNLFGENSRWVDDGE